MRVLMMNRHPFFFLHCYLIFFIFAMFFRMDSYAKCQSYIAVNQTPAIADLI